MNTKNLFFTACALMGLASCQMMEGEGVASPETGTLKLGVEASTPLATRAGGNVDVSKFAVEISTADVNGYKANYEVQNLPETLTLPVGEYTVAAHTPGNCEKKMSAPYYQGSKTMTIEPGVTTKTEVVCKQRNSKIQVAYGESFLEVYSQWNITIDDGSNMVLAFDQQDLNPAPVYWLFGEGVSQLTVNFYGMDQLNGTPVKGRTIIKKSDAAELYDDDQPYFAGGDAVVLNFSQSVIIVPETTGTVGVHNVTVNLTFADQTEGVTIPVDWDAEDTPSGDQTQKPVIIFNLPSVTATAEGGPELYADIQTSYGLKSVLVKAESTGNFQAALADLQESGLNLLEGHELVGDEVLPMVFEGLGVEAEMPKMGDKSYPFNIANFYPFLAMYGPSTTKFSIVVEDLAGNEADGSVVVTITE